MFGKSTAISCVAEKRCYASGRLAVLRCTQCRILVDVASAHVARCAACGGPLAEAVAPPTVWDDEDPTERRPISYVADLARRRPA